MNKICENRNPTAYLANDISERMDFVERGFYHKFFEITNVETTKYNSSVEVMVGLKGLDDKYFLRDQSIIRRFLDDMRIDISNIGIDGIIKNLAGKVVEAFFDENGKVVALSPIYSLNGAKLTKDDLKFAYGGHRENLDLAERIRNRIEQLEKQFSHYSDWAHKLVFSIKNTPNDNLRDIKKKIPKYLIRMRSMDREYRALSGNEDSHPNYCKFMTCINGIEKKLYRHISR